MWEQWADVPGMEISILSSPIQNSREVDVQRKADTDQG